MKEYWDKRYATDFCDIDIIPSEFVKRTAERIRDKKVRSILDIGCGAGRDTLYFADLNYKVTALDLSAKALSLFQEIPKNVEFICDDIKNVNFAADSFDLVYANLTLHYFDNQTTKRVIANITQSLTSGGVLTFLCKSTKDPLYGVGTRVEDNVYDDRYRHHFFDNNYIKELLTDYNVELVQESEGFYYKPCAFIEAFAVKK